MSFLQILDDKELKRYYKRSLRRARVGVPFALRAAALCRVEMQKREYYRQWTLKYIHTIPVE